ncbi:PREDICTED: T-lymphocyte activation antigen CD80 [Elephantulus edwardii]|uniref:T-lymphocyte activation antigen CD80 n=1 Tax=Elephantulus edwardii TaxID=28737 RepID=UPI0003F06F2D|nr:PREDICTED: T-lymphocyte activation antigen CD80 [Elephantulus edwardii]
MQFTFYSPSKAICPVLPTSGVQSDFFPKGAQCDLPVESMGSDSNSQIIKSVKEIAVLPCDYNVPDNQLKNFRIYWQTNEEVVLTIMSGKVSKEPKYLNRTLVDIPRNLSIIILNLRPSDTGTYTCVVLKNEKGYFKREHLVSVDLLVRADFHDPVINELESTSNGIKKILCSTSGGFPKPHLSWLENGEELTAGKTIIVPDLETELYTISSELLFNVTRNHTLVCLINYGDKQVSKNISLVMNIMMNLRLFQINRKEGNWLKLEQPYKKY